MTRTQRILAYGIILGGNGVLLLLDAYPEAINVLRGIFLVALIALLVADYIAVVRQPKQHTGEE